jgi:hypothetical protein
MHAVISEDGEGVLNGYVTNPYPTPTLTPNPNSNPNRKLMKKSRKKQLLKLIKLRNVSLVDGN